MKKFYYKKEAPQDKTPIVLRLERRHTMDIKQDGMKEEQNHLSARATSISSLDQLTAAIPRVRTREVAKSLSEDVLSKGQSKRIVTETDLSSSWLYKTMQASVNSKFKSPRKSPSLQQTEDLAPVVLQDPSLKPIPVKSRAKRPSCMFHFGAMIAISLCTVGFLASIAGIIYMDVFATRNLTSLQTSETQVDLSDVVFDSGEDHNILTTLDIGEHELKQTFFKETTTKDINDSLSESEGQIAVGRTLDIEKSDVAELNKYIDATKAKIKFQDGETVIYEVESSDSIEYERSSNTPDGYKDSLNQTEGNSFKNKKSPEEVIEEKLDEKLEIVLDSQFEKLKDTFVAESKGVSGTKLPDATFPGNQLKDDLEEFASDRELRPESVSETIVKLNESKKSESGIEVMFARVPESSARGPNLETNDIFYGDNKIEVKESNHDSKPATSDPSDLSKAQGMQESQPVQHEDEISPSVQYADENVIKSEHDVDSMVMTVDDPEEVSTDSFISNRNGEINLSDFSSSRPSVHPNFMENGDERPVLPKKTDIKISLAEAMKHLQVLDVNNKLLTSRIKSAKPKADTSKKQKQNNGFRQDQNNTLEKMRYLQKVRLMLYEHLQ